MMAVMTQIRRFDHVGITVADLDSVTTFFVGLGLEVEGRMFVESEFLDTVIGMPDSRTQIVMLRPPDGGTGIELSSFVRPDHEPGSPTAMANELGLRNVCFDRRRPPGGRRRSGCGRLRTGRRHRSAREHLAHGLRAGAGGNRRLAGRADGLTPGSCPLRMRHSAVNEVSPAPRSG